MSPQSKEVLKQALCLSPVDRAELVEEILSSFDFPSRQHLDALWAAEAEERIDAYDAGEIGASPASEVFNKLAR